jgi:hypothetical protein
MVLVAVVTMCDDCGDFGDCGVDDGTGNDDDNKNGDGGDHVDDDV